MIQASQRAVFQEANMNLINIRNIEVEYFRNFFTQFGTQCALMIGLIAGSISQAPGLDNPSNAPYPWLVMYWIGSAGTVATAIHVLVCTVFIAVFGQGLAIRGPLGSMVTAVEGMIIEQQQVLFFYVLTVVFFAFQAVGLYWVMMDWISAIVSTIITFFAAIFWYHHSLRIYNRFYWNKEKVDWEDEFQSPDEALRELYPELDASKYAGADSGAGKKKKTQLERILHTKTRPQFFDINTPGFGFERKAAGGDVDDEPGVDSGGFRDHSGTTAAKDFRDDDDIVIGGYMSIATPGNKRLFSTVKQPVTWERRYFIVKGTHIFFYKDQNAYNENPTKPINRRPIDLEGYTLLAGNLEPPYMISLHPGDPDDVRKAWKFRCDTIAEFESWIGILTNALKLCESEFSSSDVIRVEGKELDRLSQATYDYGDGDDDDDDDDLGASLAAYAAAREEIGGDVGMAHMGMAAAAASSSRAGVRTVGHKDGYVLYEDEKNDSGDEATSSAFV